MRALAIAATGMSAQQLNVEVIANNIANINTTSYKRSRAEFTDLFYQVDRMQGVPNRAGEAAVPEGAKLGLGVRSVAVRKLHMQGSLAQTGNTYDLAVNGRGWFQVVGPNGETLYTRAGAFNTNADRQLVTADGYHGGSRDHHSAGDGGCHRQPVRPGVRQARHRDRAAPGGPAQPCQLRQRGGPRSARRQSLSRDDWRPASPSSASPGDPGFGKIHQHYLESSNVDPVKEITELISAQRSYEMNSKVIQAADEMASTISKGLR